MIEIRNLTKAFDHRDRNGHLTKKIAVDDLNFTIERGEVIGLLGKNGAGKTTTIRMLTLQTRPTSGEIFFDGVSDELDIKKMIGVVPQHINFDQDLTVGENMELHARLHHIDRQTRHRRIKELLDYVELGDVINDGVKQLSGGMKRRLLIIRAMIHRPQILFLDEPTVALDPQVRRRIWDLIRRLKAEGVTIVLTTHYIEEAEALCDRTAFLSKGRLIALDTPQALRAEHGASTLEEVFIALTEAKL